MIHFSLKALLPCSGILHCIQATIYVYFGGEILTTEKSRNMTDGKVGSGFEIAAWHVDSGFCSVVDSRMAFAFLSAPHALPLSLD